ncbi:MAG TPA: DUF1064 domain-containing protein [Caldimonas sp.]|nr:DUF1064 domain-containing protein [Caldimonas sp.]
MKPRERKAWTEVLTNRMPGAKVMRTVDGETRLVVTPAEARTLGEACAAERRSKMGNRAVREDGRRFASRLEADRYLELKALRASGAVAYFLRQVPFELAGGVTYRCDFAVAYKAFAEGAPLVFEDTKGFLTETARVKLRLVEELYGVRVKLLRREDVKRMRS